ncbi:MAG: nitronate monooxygenase [Candidatus Nitrosocosmicus sp.]|nr:nitronate monooxygenase [Candidatus Nitrosocosmicus sp.]
MGIRYPIFQAGMSGPSTPELVAAVSNAGGLGILGAESFTQDQLIEKIKYIRKLTDLSFGINILLVKQVSKLDTKQCSDTQQFLNSIRDDLEIPKKDDIVMSKCFPPEIKSLTKDIEEKIKIMIEMEVPLISFGLGDPTPYIKQIQINSNSKIMSMVTTVDEAIYVAHNGVDIVAAQGGEAGGHRSSITNNFDSGIPLIGTMTLVPQVVDALANIHKEKGVLTIAAGGIMNGRGLIASLCLGASGVLMGTRFLLAKESSVFQGYKNKLLDSKETDTVITKAYSGMPARSIRNEFTNRYEDIKPKILPWPLQWENCKEIYEHSKRQNTADFYPILAGQGIRLLKHDQSAADIIKEIIKEAKSIIAIISE